MNKETIICEKCGCEVIKRSINHKLCMKCSMDFHKEKIKELRELDDRNEYILLTKRHHDKNKT